MAQNAYVLSQGDGRFISDSTQVPARHRKSRMADFRFIVGERPVSHAPVHAEKHSTGDRSIIAPMPRTRSPAGARSGPWRHLHREMVARSSGGHGADAYDVTFIPRYSLGDNTGASLLHPLVLFSTLLRTAGAGRPVRYHHDCLLVHREAVAVGFGQGRKPETNIPGGAQGALSCWVLRQVRRLPGARGHGELPAG